MAANTRYRLRLSTSLSNTNTRTISIVSITASESRSTRRSTNTSLSLYDEDSSAIIDDVSRHEFFILGRLACLRTRLPRMDNTAFRWIASQIAIFYVDAGLRFGHHAGYQVNARLEFVTELNVGGVRQTRTMYDHDVGVGVIVIDAANLRARPRNVITQYRGEGVLVIDEVRVPSPAVRPRDLVKDGKLIECKDLATRDTCPVCLDNFCESSSRVLKTPCGHHFHDRCITRWLQTKVTCPICRRTVA